MVSTRSGTGVSKPNTGLSEAIEKLIKAANANISSAKA
jgi:hypothetical protein